MEHCFGDRRFLWLAPSDWSLPLMGVALGAVFILFV
jgi:hypothetical protein